MSATDTTDADAGPPESQLSMGIDPYERNWMRASVLLLVAFAATVTIAGFAMGFELPGADREVDPRTLLDTPPWDEPGVREVAPGVYEAYVIAQTWAFVPREIEVPLGSEITIFVTSPDVQHGLKITDTNINMQIVPGHVSKLTYTADEVGEFPYICHEYCGSGHAAMFGVLRVVAPGATTEADTDTTPDESAAAEEAQP